MNPIHAWDQAGAALRDVAVTLGNYYKELIKQGFTAEQAFTLTMQQQEILFRNLK